jgi:putative ABC transport system ATP-binding protein
VGAAGAEGTPLTGPSPLVVLDDVERVFRRGPGEVRALHGVSLSIDEGEFVAVLGHSGSGKTTLLSILGCLDQPTRGSYRLGGIAVSEMEDTPLSRVRNRTIGFVFQSFQLIPQLTVRENVETPLLYADCPPREARERALLGLARVGLAARADHRPQELSGGEAQRAAVARALVNEPRLVLADEPTGNLDSETGDQIAGLLSGLHERGTTVILVTHNATLAQRARRRIVLRDGAVAEDTGRPL